MSVSDDELVIGGRDFNKVIEIHAKEGYKEGISNGRDSEFQSGFDLGFGDGLRAGFAVGQLTALNELNTDVSSPDPTKLPCECCKSGLDHPPPLQEISEINRRSIQTLENQLPNKAGPPNA